VYDEAGRLVGVIDPSGDAAAYHYDSVGNLLGITRATSSQVSIIEITPDAGPIGQTVTIYGTGFSATPSSNSVSFNGTSASITSASTTSLVVSVPGGATTGTISITSPNGSANSADPFVVAADLAPTISGFSPAIGVAGTAVTITGTNFATAPNQNRVAVNQTFTYPTSVSSTSLVTSVPLLTGSGPVKVRTAHGVAVSTADFFIPPPPFVASDVIVTGRLPFSTPTNFAIGTAAKIGLVLFDGAASQRISLLASGPLGQITLHAPNQALVESQGVGVGSVLLESSFLPATGPYQFTLDPVGSATGTYNLTLYDVPPDFSTIITPSQPGGQAIVTTTVPGQNGRVTWTGAANDRVSVRISSGPLGSVTVQKPDGAALDSGSIGVLTSFIEPVVLPEAGTYKLFADYNGAGTGSVTLTAYLVPPDVTGSVTPGGSSVNVVITTPGQNGELTFSGTSGQRVSLRTAPSAPFGSVSLHRPNGTQQALVSTGIAAAFMEPQTLSETDTYSIRVNPSGVNTGTVTITLYDVPPDTTGSVSIGGSAVPVTLGTPGQNGTLTFSGTASQQVTVRMTGDTFGGSTTVRLLKPDGSQLTSSTSGSANFNLATQVLPTTGTYTIVVDPSSNNTGSVNVAVTNP
jgi:YD repeat-containing protein